MRASSPALSEGTFNKQIEAAGPISEAEEMTLGGTVRSCLGLLVTLVWLYLEILGLLAKIRR